MKDKFIQSMKYITLVFALIFLIIAAIIIILSMFKFKKIKTTISPLRPNKTSSLVNTGIYEYTRNPMYLGLLLMLFSTALFLKNLISFLIIPLFILFITKNQILPEEEALENIFGEEYILFNSDRECQKS